MKKSRNAREKKGQGTMRYLEKGHMPVTEGESAVRHRRRLQRIRRTLLALTTACLLCFLTACGTQTETGDAGGTGADGGSQTVLLQDFQAQDFNEVAYGPGDLAEKDLTVLNIWATWCGYCVQEMPDLAAIEQTLPDNVALITYCTDGRDSRDLARQILDESGFQGVALYDGMGDMKALEQGVTYLPTTVFLDREGRQVCDPISGAPQDPQKAYMEQINKALEAVGAETIQP